MSDPLTIVGGLAAIIQIADALTHLTSQLRLCLRTVRNAPQEVRKFHLDLSNFSATLRLFYDNSDSWLSDLEESQEKEDRKQHIAGVIQECRAVEDGFDELLHRFLGESNQLPTIYTYLDRFRWYLRRPLVAGLRLSLESAKSSVMLFVLLYMCQSLQRKVYELQRALQEIPVDLKNQLQSTEKQLKEQIRATKTAHRRLKQYLEKPSFSTPPLIPDVRPIIEETWVVECHATKSLRKETRRIRREISSTRRPQESQTHHPSPGPWLATRELQNPRQTPSDSGNIGISHRKTNGHPDIRNIHACDRTDHHSTCSHGSLGSELHTIASVETSHPAIVVESRRSMTPESLEAMEPKIVGPIIHDDGKEVRERVGEWRTEASVYLPAATESDSNASI